MYCPVCGFEGTEGLNFCKRCGSSLSQPLKPSEPKINYGKLAGMFWAVAVFGVVSLGTLIGSIIPLTIFNAGKQIIIPVMAFGSAAIVLIAAMLIKQLARLIHLATGEESSTPPGKISVNRPARPQIAAPPQNIGSVTEHTTRTFDPAYRDSERQ